MINACVIGLGYVGLPILINLSKKLQEIIVLNILIYSKLHLCRKFYDFYHIKS